MPKILLPLRDILRHYYADILPLRHYMTLFFDAMLIDAIFAALLRRHMRC